MADGLERLQIQWRQDPLAVATTPDRICEVAYYLAVRALAEGRRTDASDRLRIAIETGLNEEGEYVWSLRTLSRLIKGQP